MSLKAYLKESVACSAAEAFMIATDRPVPEERRLARISSTQKIAQRILFPLLPEVIQEVQFPESQITVSRAKPSSTNQPAQPWTPEDVRVHLRRRLEKEWSTF